MKPILISLLCLTTLLTACENNRRYAATSAEKALASPNNNDSLNALFDTGGDSSLLFLDTIPNESKAEIRRAVAVSKYNALQAISWDINNEDNVTLMKARRDREKVLYDGSGKWKYSQQEGSQRNEAIRMLMDKKLEAQLDSILLETGEPVVLRLLFADQLLKKAQFMYDTANYGSTDTVNGVRIRSGIKYAWGSKELMKKYNPAKVTAGTGYSSGCDMAITGLDCSGFVYQLFKQCGFNIRPLNANSLRDTTILRTAVTTYMQTPKFAIEDRRKIPVSQIESGDIIYIYDSLANNTIHAKHIGVALQAEGKLRLFHCSGGQNLCEYNVGPNGGIRCPNITKYISGKNYGVVHIKLLP